MASIDEVSRRLDNMERVVNKGSTEDAQQNVALNTIVNGFKDHVEKCHVASEKSRATETEILLRLHKNSIDMWWLKGFGFFFVVTQLEFIKTFLTSLVN